MPPFYEEISDTKKPGTPKISGYARLSDKIVPRMGVEPMISALKGRRPRPLDERGVHVTGSDCTLLLVLCQAKIAAIWQIEI